MSKAAQMLIDSIKNDAFDLVRGDLGFADFNQRLETRIQRFEDETYEYTKEALIDALKSSHLEP